MDGFYWGECRGRRGFVPNNMVQQIKDPIQPAQGQAGRRSRWGDTYANRPVKKMIALYDYDPHELSPNVDSVRYSSQIEIQLSRRVRLFTFRIDSNRSIVLKTFTFSVNCSSYLFLKRNAFTVPKHIFSFSLTKQEFLTMFAKGSCPCFRSKLNWRFKPETRFTYTVI